MVFDFIDKNTVLIYNEYVDEILKASNINNFIHVLRQYTNISIN